MKKIKLLLVAGACVVLSACSPQAPTVHTTDKGTQWEWNEGTIVVKSPERPAGQKSVIGLTAPKMEVVRVGFVAWECVVPELYRVSPIFPAPKSWRFVIMTLNVRKHARTF